MPAASCPSTHPSPAPRLRSTCSIRPLADAFITATAIVYGLTLATRNVRNFPGTGVALDPWRRAGLGQAARVPCRRIRYDGAGVSPANLAKTCGDTVRDREDGQIWRTAECTPVRRLVADTMLDRMLWAGGALLVGIVMGGLLHAMLAR